MGWIAAMAIAVVIAGAGCGDSTKKASTTTTGPLATTSTPSTSGRAGEVAVRVYFTPDSGGPDCSETTPVDRTVQGPDVLAGTLRELLAGPTAAERDAGLGSWFSADTADSLRSVKVVDGTAHIDFEDFSRRISGASSSCGSSQLTSQLDRTARQFPTVERTLYSFNGDVEAFYAWLQGEPPSYYTPTSSSTS